MTASETLSLYIDHAGQWRWRVQAEDGKVVASAEQGFDTKTDCQQDAQQNGFLHTSADTFASTESFTYF